MNETSPSTQWIDLRHCDDPRDAVHRAVACLAQGGVLGLATETTYGLTASALNPGALRRLRSLAGVEPTQRLTLLIKGPEEVPDWAPGISRTSLRLARRLWPGPLTMVVSPPASEGLLRRLPAEVQPLLAPDKSVELANSSEPFLRDILELSPAPLIFSGLAGASGPLTSPEPLQRLDGLDMVADSGPIRAPGVPTRIRIRENGWTIEQAGTIDERTLTQMSGLIILFVCTGNTCRSPMAEAICKLLLTRKLGCSIDELEARGYLALSAGVSATNGAPAASNAVNVLRTLGGSLEQHRSRRVTVELLRAADYVFAMTIDHLETLVEAIPEVSSHAYLLDPLGGDVPDPIGSDHTTYRQTAERIERMLELRLKELGL